MPNCYLSAGIAGHLGQCAGAGSAWGDVLWVLQDGRRRARRAWAVARYLHTEAAEKRLVIANGSFMICRCAQWVI